MPVLNREAYDLFTSSNIALEAMWYMLGEGVERLKEKESSYLAIVIGQVLRKGDTKVKLYLGDNSELMPAQINGEGKKQLRTILKLS